MPPIEDFEEFKKMLEEHPEWREELRRLLFTEEWLSLPYVVRESTAKQEALRQEMEGMREWMEEIARAQLATQEALKCLAERVESLVEGLEEMRRQREADREELRGWFEEMARQREADREEMRGMREWMEEIARAQLATQEALKRLAERVESLSERIDRVDAQIERLTERMDRVDAQIERLTERIDRVDAQIERLTERMDRVDAQIERLTERMDRVDAQIERLTRSLVRLWKWQEGEAGRREGERYERHIVRRAPSIFSGGYGGSPEEPVVKWRLSRWLEQIYDKGVKFSEEEDPFLADLIWWKGDKVAVVEVSLKVKGSDVMRAKKRAEFLKSLGVDAIPIVIGQRWATSRTEKLAEAEGVDWLVGITPSPGFVLFCSESRKLKG